MASCSNETKAASPNYKLDSCIERDVPLTEALCILIEVQKRLFEQLEVGPEEIYVVRRTSDDSEQNRPLSSPLAALDFSIRLVSAFISWGRKKIDPSRLDSMGESKPVLQGIVGFPERREANEESSSLESEGIDSYGVQNIDENAEEHDTIFNLRPQAPGDHTAGAFFEDNFFSFKSFDIAKVPLDHYYVGVKKQNNNGRKWLKKVQQDWSVLQSNLPDGIYVRVYEDRMDLLRALIVGAYGTPYQDSLFVFDLHLPPMYPYAPPSLYYHSGGWSINPNLDDEGHVCLSLLNTTTGTENEVWNPLSSNILQVLLSLQGLVLNSKPYFNEAAIGNLVGTAEGEKNSLSYNENTFLLNCKLMMYHMRKPPKDFEELVKDHFKRRGYYILKACDAYLKGYLIGTLTKDASISDKSNEHSNSVGFKLMMAKIVPKLILALSEVGANCQDFKHLQESQCNSV